MSQTEPIDTTQQSSALKHREAPYYLTTQWSEDIPESYWVASLTNHVPVYFDPLKIDNLTAWQRLKRYCETEKVDIDNIRIQFRSHIEIIRPKAKGYFFLNGSVGIFGMVFDLAPNDPPRNLNEFRFGVLEDDGKIYVQNWLIPELIINGDSVREAKEYKDHIIINSSYNGPSLD